MAWILPRGGSPRLFGEIGKSWRKLAGKLNINKMISDGLHSGHDRRLSAQGTEAPLQEGDRRRVSPEQADKVERILARLDEATEPANMDLPGYRIHPLKGDLAEYWFVSVSGQLAHHFPLRRRACLQRGFGRLPLGGRRHGDEEPTPSGIVGASRLSGDPLGLSVTGGGQEVWRQPQAGVGHRQRPFRHLAG